VRPALSVRKEAAVILGIGVDLVSVARLKRVMDRRGARARSRFFTGAEVERCRLSRSPEESFAARFAAKEAFFKALGSGVGSAGRWHDAEVVSAASGAPSLRLSGRAAEAARLRGVTRIHLALTHTGDTAAAVVVLEGAG
jgi:holo-[acyl-carrier protein] synthase